MVSDTVPVANPSLLHHNSHTSTDGRRYYESSESTTPNIVDLVKRLAYPRSFLHHDVFVA